MQDNGLAKALALAAQFGFAIAGPMVIFIGGGAWLDSQFHTTPWLLFVGIFLGLAAAGFAFYEVLSLQTRRDKAKQSPRAPYKVERDEDSESIGTNRADKRKHNGSQ